MTRERDVFIRQLCSLSSQNSGEFTEKQILCCKTLFNVSHWMPSILDAENWRVIMTTLFKVDKLLQKYLISEKRRADKPDFIKIQKSIKDSLMNNPVVSKVYKIDIISKEPAKSIPSSEISRSLNPSGKLQFSQESEGKSKVSNDGRLKSARGAKPTEDMCPYPDLEILKSALDSLFTSTYIQDDRILIEFAKGLAKITKSTFEDNKSSQNVVPTIK